MLKYLRILPESETVQYYDDVENDFDDLIEGICRKTRRKNKIEYYNIPCAFDIETSSFYDNGRKAGCMYIWMFSIDDRIIIGRTWDEFLLLLEKLHDCLSLHNNFRRLICYVHNLGYEFAWFCNRIQWEKVFAVNYREPLTALTTTGIEFRCSLKLSGYKLEKIGEELQKYTVKKLVGNLDYSKIRHSETPLTDKELAYCINDVRVLSAYIRETIENDGGITKIPLTKTGYVRLYCREHIFGGRSHRREYHIYNKVMEHLTLDPDEFKMLLRAFQGGFTHASTFFSNKDEPLHGVTGFDYCSKYPSAMIAELYPMSKGEFYQPVDNNDLKQQLKKYCCVFDVRFIGLKPIVLYDNYLSISKCFNVKNPVVNNGRLVSADDLITTITNVDFEVIKLCYRWDRLEIGKFIRYEKRYLPTDFVNCILDFYEKKTTLKDVSGYEVEYNQHKGLLNSCYGCTVTNPCKELITYDQDKKEWTSDSQQLREFQKQYRKEQSEVLKIKIENLKKKMEDDFNKLIDKYNKKKDRFLFYPWGVFVTAYCRRDIWKYGILKAGKDYVYSDTDSVKFVGDHPGFEKEYNKMILKKLQKACRYHGISLSRVAPKTKDGVLKPLGVFEFDGHYSDFKTLGAKRYMMTYSDDKRNKKKNRGKTVLTVAGLNKEKGAEYLKMFSDPFKEFRDDMSIPKEYSGRQTATYIDEPISGIINDYLGNRGEYHEMSCLHLEASEYTMSMAGDYIDYLLDIQEGEDIE